MTAAVLERTDSTSAARTSAGRATAGRATAGRATAGRVPARRVSTGRAYIRRPKLKVLDHRATRQRARRRNALLVLFVVVLAGFFGVALVQAQLVAGQQDLDSIRARIAEAEAHKAKVARETEEASSPQAIVSRAEELGMVRAFNPIYLEAAAPLRELTQVAALAPRSPSRSISVAAAPGIEVGISSSAPVAVAKPVEQQTAAAPVASASPTTGTDQATASLGGLSASSSGSDGSIVAPSPESPTGTAGATTIVGTATQSGAAGAAAITTSSIAGSRAVSGGIGAGSASG